DVQRRDGIAASVLDLQGQIGRNADGPATDDLEGVFVVAGPGVLTADLRSSRAGETACVGRGRRLACEVEGEAGLGQDLQCARLRIGYGLNVWHGTKSRCHIVEALCGRIDVYLRQRA